MTVLLMKKMVCLLSYSLCSKKTGHKFSEKQLFSSYILCYNGAIKDLEREFMKEKTFRDGIRDALPTALGYVSIGLACGVVASPYLSPLEMGLMSLLVYAGASQFAMIALLAAQQSFLDISITVFLINLRNMLMSLHTSPDFKEASLLQNIGIGSLLTDESYGVYLTEKLNSKQVTVPWMHGNNVLGYIA